MGVIMHNGVDKRAMGVSRCAGHIRMTLLQGPIRDGFLISLPCAGVSAALKYVDYDNGLGKDFIADLMPESEAYNGFNFLLGFFIIFHTSHAYERLMRGAEMLYTVLGSLVEVTSLLFAFARVSKADQDATVAFKDQFVRLMSLLFAVSVGSLEGDGDVKAHGHKLIDLENLPAEQLKRIVATHHKPEVVCQMAQALIVDSISSKVMCIPPPLLTRAFQKLGDAMVKLYEVQAYRDTPFPNSLILVTYLLLAIQWLIAPFFMAHWSEGIFGAAGYTFITVFVLQALHAVALVLDNPFGNDASDLDREFMQELMNENLIALLQESCDADENGGSSLLPKRFNESSHEDGTCSLNTLVKKCHSQQDMEGPAAPTRSLDADKAHGASLPASVMDALREANMDGEPAGGERAEHSDAHAPSYTDVAISVGSDVPGSHVGIHQ